MTQVVGSAAQAASHALLAAASNGAVTVAQFAAVPGPTPIRR
jgi:hypothetical protein